METSMLGPFTIVKLEGKSADLVMPKSKVIHKVNTDQLSPYIEPTPRVPHIWMIESTMSASTSAPAPSPSSPVASPSSPALSSPALSPSSPVASTSAPAPSSPALSPSSPVASTSAPAPSSPALSPSSPAPSPSPPSATVCVPSDILETVVHNIWAGKKPEVLWSKAGPYKLFTRNLQEHLRPDALVESEIINAYLTIALSNYAEAGRGRGYLVDSYQMTDIWRGKNKGLRKVDPLDYDVMIGAVCEHHHWTLTEALQKCSAVTRAFMRQRGHNCSRWSSQTVPHARQVDATSCGVIVCKIADMILNGEEMEDIFDQSSILRMRLQIGKRLIKETDDLTNLCRACGSYDTDVQWIACTPCDQWFHRSCVGQPQVDAPFYCSLCI